MKYDNQLRYAVSIIKEYDGRSPLSAWLRDFYKKNKQMGSRDRKTVSAMVYGYYRLGRNKFERTEDRIIAAIGQTNELPEIFDYFISASKKEVTAGEDTSRGDSSDLIPSHEGTGDRGGPIPSLREVGGGSVNYSQIFPWSHLLSEGIDNEAFVKSFLIQPDLFLRIRPGRKRAVLEKLEEAKISFVIEGEDCVVLPNSSKIDTVLEVNKEVVVQDKSSQRTSSLLDETDFPTQQVSVWDCCAASGGKSIMIYDKLPSVDLTASDNRIAILRQLDERFSEAGIKDYQSFVADLVKDKVVLPDKKYDLIVADVPCTGSGTWARTPEQLYFFREERIENYHLIQKSIVSRAIPKIKEKGYFLYITCSVFAKENEDIVNYIIEEQGLTLLKKKLITGYTEKADTLFAALFTNLSA